MLCVHVNYGDTAGYATGHFYTNTVKSAVSTFKGDCDLLNAYNNGGDNPPTMDIYTYDNCECDRTMNFHDYPESRYIMGIRGGIKKD